MKQLPEIFKKTYLSDLSSMHGFKREFESQDYGACRFNWNNQKVVFRIAKTTPKKVGQFVTLWKRGESGVIEPYDLKAEVDFFFIGVRTSKHAGRFMFPKNILYEKRVISGNGFEGKRAIRVYPPWDVTINRQAKNTQAWQLKYFFEITENISVLNS